MFMKLTIPPLFLAASMLISQSKNSSNDGGQEDDEDDPIAVFLDGKSKQQLKETIQWGDPNPRVILNHLPSAGDKYTFEPLMGETALVKVAAQAKASSLFKVLLPQVVYAQRPITSTGILPFLGPSDLDVAMTARVLNTLHTDIKPTMPWSGVVHAGVRSFPVVMEPFQPILQLSGMICTQKRYDAATHTCTMPKVSADENTQQTLQDTDAKGDSLEEKDSKPSECPLCKFFEASPCKDVYHSWKSCLDKVEEKGGDLFDDCGEITLGLRECILKYPDYFDAIMGTEEDGQHSTTDNQPEKRAL